MSPTQVSYKLLQRTGQTADAIEQRLRWERLTLALPASADVSQRARRGMDCRIYDNGVVDAGCAEVRISAVLATPSLYRESHRTCLPDDLLAYADLRGIGAQAVVRASTQLSIQGAVERYIGVYGEHDLEAAYALAGRRLSYNIAGVERHAREAPSSRPIAALKDIADSGKKLRIAREDLEIQDILFDTQIVQNSEALIALPGREAGMCYLSSTGQRPYVQLFCDSLDDMDMREALLELKGPEISDHDALTALDIAQETLARTRDAR